jgi:hypothetical protein
MPYPVDHMDDELRHWLIIHHDPAWKPKKPRFVRPRHRKLSDSQRSTLQNEWAWEVERQILMYGPPSHLPLKYVELGKTFDKAKGASPSNDL